MTMYNQDFKKSMKSKEKANPKKYSVQYLPLSFERILAYTKFLLPFSIWNNPTSPIYKNEEVIIYCSKTLFSILSNT